jgi:hypothetical protein
MWLKVQRACGVAAATSAAALGVAAVPVGLVSKNPPASLQEARA